MYGYILQNVKFAYAKEVKVKVKNNTQCLHHTETSFLLTDKHCSEVGPIGYDHVTITEAFVIFTEDCRS